MLYFWSGTEALKQISFILMHCALVQVSEEQSWSTRTGFLSDEIELKHGLQEGIYKAPATGGCSVHGLRPEMLWNNLPSCPRKKCMFCGYPDFSSSCFSLQVCCSCFANLFLSWLSSNHLKHVDWGIDRLLTEFAHVFVRHMICSFILRRCIICEFLNLLEGEGWIFLNNRSV